MIFVETSVFTRRATQLLPDDDYRELQASLVEILKKGQLFLEAVDSIK